MNEPIIRKIKVARPYAVHPDDGRIYSFYEVSVRWPNGKREMFDSEEAANAAVENRSFSDKNFDDETPMGVKEAMALSMPLIPEAGEVTTLDESESTFDIAMISFDSKIQAIKAVRVFTGLGLKESKELVDSVPSVIKKGMLKEDAEFAKSSLEGSGVVIELR